MLIYFTEVSLIEGFKILESEKENRLVRGRKVSRPSGYALFKSIHDNGAPLRCWECGIDGNCFVLNRGKNDEVRHPVLDLFSSTENGRYILMTRDHIIPRSLGGGDSVQNLRVGCTICNGARGNQMTDEDRQFMLQYPELVVRPPNPVVEQIKLTPEEKKAKIRARRRRCRESTRLKRAVTKAVKETTLVTPELHGA